MNALAQCDLPVKSVLPALAAALQTHGRAVLSAAPGAGKTTLAPPVLLDALYGAGGKILMLEPRRIAARAAACRIASLLGEPVGKRAGYRVRGDSRVSAETRIEVITEGMLTRMMQQDPELNGVSLLIFDEFHERSLHSDLGLALALEIAGALRDDLHILVMSATLETEKVAMLLGDAPVIDAPGRMFPVEEHFGDSFGDLRDLPERMAGAIRNVAGRESGSILAFLPGAREILRTAELLRDLNDETTRVATLFGALDKKEQDAAIAPAAPGHRKIVLATNIGESSLTIEGVRVVVDSGYERVVRFDPATSMPRLEPVRISLASATQRAGRAGRLEPGAVYRLWSEADHRRLAERAVPEILEADLSTLALELALWGGKVEDMRWMDRPPKPQMDAALTLLFGLGALDDSGRLTTCGRKLAKLPVHPRLGMMLLYAEEMGLVPLACELAALIEERDILPSGTGADVGERLALWRRRSRDFRQLNVIRDQLLRLMNVDFRPQTEEHVGILIAHAYPEWIAQSRGIPGVNYLLSGGRGAKVLDSDDLRRCEFLAAARVERAGAAATIRLAAPLSASELAHYFSDRMRQEESVVFDRARNRVTGSRETRLGALVLKREPLGALSPELVAPVLAQAVRDTGVHVLELSASATGLLERVRFAARLSPDRYPDWTEAGLLREMESLLAMMPEARSFDDLRRTDWRNVLAGVLGYGLLAELDREFPERIEVPTGSKIRIDYSGEVPVLAVRVQELYGMKKHPSLGGGRLPLKLELQSPAHRTIQITMDLPGFWAANWALVRKDMRAQYPKHVWPEDPVNAAPTTRAKPRKA